MRFNKALIVFLVCTLFISFQSFFETSHAIVDGDWYVCDFEIYPVDTSYFNESVSGSVWLEGIAKPKTNCGVQDLTGNLVYYMNYQYTGMDTTLDLKVNTLQLRFNANTSNANSCNTFIYDYYFYNSANNQIFRIRFTDPSDGGIGNYVYVFDGDDAQIVLDSITSGKNDVNITLYPLTSEIETWIAGTDVNHVFVSSNFDYIDYIYIDISWLGGGGGCGAMTHYIDNFKINMGEEIPDELWRVGKGEYVGCANCEFDGYETFSFADNTQIVFESDYKEFNPGEAVLDLALGIHSNSDIDDITTWLRIGDEYLEERTQYYSYGPDLYIVVWEDVNTLWYDEILPIEFKFTDTNTNDNFNLTYVHSDGDGDGDIQYKYSYGPDNFNGAYDGDYSIGRDLCIEIYTGNIGLGGDVNISVYNESNLTESLVGWSVTIVNKVTGFIEYTLNDCTNPTIINTTDIGLGKRYFIIENESYYPRTYYGDIQPFVNYTLDAYLAPISESQIYCLRVIEDLTDYGEEIPIPDAHVIIRKYINATVGYINISNTFTDYMGITYVALIPGETYHFWISKTGYQSEYTHFIIAENKDDCYTFKLEINFTGGYSWDKWYQNITLLTEMVSAGYLQDGNVTVYYLDHNYSTIDTDCYLYEIFNDVTTYKNYSHNVSNEVSLRFGEINTTRTHLIYFWYNNTASFIDQISPVVIVLDPIHIYRGSRTRFSFDERTKAIIGPLLINGVDVGWHNALALIIGFALLCLFGPFHVGISLIASGAGIGLTNGIFGLWLTDSFPVLLITLMPIFIMLGVLHIRISGGIKL